MAQRRMLSKSISTSTKLAEVSTFAKLLFTWIIPHCDDYGRLEGSARIVKGIVVPLCDESVDQVEEALVELTRIGLINRYKVQERQYLEVNKWTEHQTLRSDRPLRASYPKNPVNTMGIPWDTNGIPMGEFSQPKLSEVKLSEVKIDRGSLLQYWNSKKIIVHKKLSKEAENELGKIERSGKYTEAEIKKSIDLYATILECGVPDSQKQFFWSYTWNFYEFLKRGLPKFDGKRPQDYAKGRKKATVTDSF